MIFRLPDGMTERGSKSIPRNQLARREREYVGSKAKEREKTSISLSVASSPPIERAGDRTIFVPALLQPSERASTFSLLSFFHAIERQRDAVLSLVRSQVRKCAYFIPPSRFARNVDQQGKRKNKFSIQILFRETHTGSNNSIEEGLSLCECLSLRRPALREELKF